MLRKQFPAILIFVLTAVLAAGFLFKDEMNDFISEKMKQQAGTEIILSGEIWVDSLFNYTKNEKDYQYSLLQFKSSGCNSCKRMEPELENIRQAKGEEVNVVVLNIMNPNSRNVMKYFGISAVPTQVLLDKQGNEIYRNYGFVSAQDLLQKLQP